MAPLEDTYIGFHDLKLKGKYTAAKYDAVVPAYDETIFDINIIV